ncbi:hypothetical protein T439DRAFT_337655 [Meredithblackwellia eburnea MCA 4105]
MVCGSDESEDCGCGNLVKITSIAGSITVALCVLWASPSSVGTFVKYAGIFAPAISATITTLTLCSIVTCFPMFAFILAAILLGAAAVDIPNSNSALIIGAGQCKGCTVDGTDVLSAAELVIQASLGTFTLEPIYDKGPQTSRYNSGHFEVNVNATLDDFSPKVKPALNTQPRSASWDGMGYF